jgi:CHAT domain-containing protein
LDYYSQALALHRTVGDPRLLATALRNIGDLHRQSGEYQKALDYFNEGLQMSRGIGDRRNEAGILALVASLERDRGNLAAARQRIEEALIAFESLRASVKSHQLRASFLATVRKYYGFEIDVLMRLHKQNPSEGFDAAALDASERSRARSFLELLGEAQIEIRQGVDPALIERERMLRQSISDKAERQLRMLSGKHTQEQAAGAAKEIDALTTEYDQLQGRIRETSPRYAALTQPVPLGAKAIQQQVLDDDTVLLEYALGDEKSFLWAVTPARIKSVELPKRSEIEQAARRVHDLSTARNKQVPNETIEQRRVRLERADAECATASSTLGQMLLGPIAAELKNKRLVIVSDGILQYVPFAALPNPVAADAHPLILDNEIVSLPSASVLAVIRQETAKRKPADKALAVLADPVFSTSDPRVQLSGSQGAATIEPNSVAADAKRSAAESGLGDLDRLRFSRQEADEITRLAAEKMKLKAVDFAANRPLATSGEIGQYRIVHLAAHGLINNEHPELSGVVLSLVDQQGRPQNGFLRLYDIYNLKLAADLVVLSACQTALGKEINGEGIVGMTRGFMYAGAPRVVASLWRIDDRATAELMKRFYGAMLGESLRPAQALRTAQISMWKEKRWQSPYYWAAFTLQGEWK